MNPQLQQTIADYFKVSKEQIKKETVADDIPDWDSFSHMDLMNTIEESLGVELPFDAIMEFACVGDIDQFISSKI